MDARQGSSKAARAKEVMHEGSRDGVMGPTHTKDGALSPTDAEMSGQDGGLIVVSKKTLERRKQAFLAACERIMSREKAPGLVTSIKRLELSELARLQKLAEEACGCKEWAVKSPQEALERVLEVDPALQDDSIFVSAPADDEEKANHGAESNQPSAAAGYRKGYRGGSSGGGSPVSASAMEDDSEGADAGQGTSSSENRRRSKSKRKNKKSLISPWLVKERAGKKSGSKNLVLSPQSRLIPKSEWNRPLFHSNKSKERRLASDYILAHNGVTLDEGVGAKHIYLPAEYPRLVKQAQAMKDRGFENSVEAVNELRRLCPGLIDDLPPASSSSSSSPGQSSSSSKSPGAIDAPSLTSSSSSGDGAHLQDNSANDADKPLKKDPGLPFSSSSLLTAVGPACLEHGAGNILFTTSDPYDGADVIILDDSDSKADEADDGQQEQAVAGKKRKHRSPDDDDDDDDDDGDGDVAKGPAVPSSAKRFKGGKGRSDNDEDASPASSTEQMLVAMCGKLLQHAKAGLGDSCVDTIQFKCKHPTGARMTVTLKLGDNHEESTSSSKA